MTRHFKSLEDKSLLSRLSILLAISLVCSIVIYFVSQGFHQRYFKYDAWGYYIYLPSFFIYHDALTLQHVGDAMWRYDLSHVFFQAMRLDNGNYVFGYTGGVAMMQSPFFFVAHAIATLFHLQADGYSPIYQFFIICSGFFWGLCGVFNCYNILNRYFSFAVSIATCVILVFATNLYNYMFWENGMTHVYSFFLISACIKGCLDFWAVPTYRRAATVGLALGFIILIRPTNLIICLPLLFISPSFTTAGIRPGSQWVIRHWRMIALAAALAVIPFGMQTIYWRWATGLFLFNPYGHLGFGFHFLRAHIAYGLFSPQKGWFFYSPAMLFIFPGLLIMFFRPRVFLHPLAILLYLSLHVWIVYSWEAYDYGSAYGARPLVDTYALLAIPLAYFIDLAFSQAYSRLLTLLCMACLAANNIAQTWKFDIGYLSGAGYSRREVMRTYFDFENEHTHLAGTGVIQGRIVHHQESLRIQMVEESASNSDILSFTFDSIPGDYHDYYIRGEVVGRYHPIDILEGKSPASLIITQDTNGEYYTWKSYSIPPQTRAGDSTLRKIAMVKDLVRPFGKKDQIKCWLIDGSSNKFELHSIKFDIIRK